MNQWSCRRDPSAETHFKCKEHTMKHIVIDLIAHLKMQARINLHLISFALFFCFIYHGDRSICIRIVNETASIFDGSLSMRFDYGNVIRANVEHNACLWMIPLYMSDGKIILYMKVIIKISAIEIECPIDCVFEAGDKQAI